MFTSAKLLPACGGLLWVLGVATGCGGGGPTARLDAYAEALRDERYEAAYEMMSLRYREAVTRERFVTRLENDRSSVSDLLALLEQGRGAMVETAEVHLADGTPIQFRREQDKWLITSHSVDFYSQTTPRLALRTFVRAVERKRYDVLLLLVPESERSGIDEESLRRSMEEEQPDEIDALLGRLRASLHNPIEEIGNRAVMRYGSRYAVRFLLEDGSWRIEDPD